MGCRFTFAAVFSDEAQLTSPELRIHESSLAHNLRRFKEIAPNSRILLPVKANAYGCGIATLFPFFMRADVDMLGVANTREAIELRELGWQKPILNLGGFFPDQIDDFAKHNISASITDPWQIEALDALGSQVPIAIHIKLDLGMGRIGIRRDAITALLQKLKAAKNLKVAGIFTHFPHSGPEARDATLAQNTEFSALSEKVIGELKISRGDVLLHTANSYNAAFFPETHHDMIRPGILFYGYYQSESDRKKFNARLDFRSSLELLATPISHRTLTHGEGVSYASLYTVEAAAENIAVLPLGYADGIPRALSNQISFGAYPLRGRVTMDQIMLGNFDGATSVRLLGEGVPSLEYWGELAHSFSYELMSHLGNRLRRVLV